MIKFLNWLISKIKKGSYQVDKDIPSKDLVWVLVDRGFQLIRGKMFNLLNGRRSRLFLGKRVSIKHVSRIIFSDNLIIEDNVLINALSHEGIILGENVTIGRNASVICTGVIRNLGVGLKIGNDSSIGAYSFLGCQGGIEIGISAIMGPYVKIFSEDHNFHDPTIPIKYQGETRKRVKIGNYCWIGAGAIILAGVEIGDYVVIAAGAVVTKSIPHKSIVAGVPAKIIKSLTDENTNSI